MTKIFYLFFDTPRMYIREAVPLLASGIGPCPVFRFPILLSLSLSLPQQVFPTSAVRKVRDDCFEFFPSFLGTARPFSFVFLRWPFCFTSPRCKCEPPPSAGCLLLNDPITCPRPFRQPNFFERVVLCGFLWVGVWGLLLDGRPSLNNLRKARKSAFPSLRPRTMGPALAHVVLFW